MKGIIDVRVFNRKVDFKFELYRNITVVRGDSGTGKTTLFNLISEYARLGDESGVTISCAKNCVALTDSDWMNQIEKTTDSIVFVDEGERYVYTKDFARALKNSDNYYVLFIRENLHELPYSVEEIYTIKTSGKYHKFVKLYKRTEEYVYSSPQNKMKYEKILLEDTKAGYQFYQSRFKNDGIECVSAGNNTGIYSWLENHINQKVLVIADGAAFGSEINRVISLQKRYPDNIIICLPESFEWLILKSGLINSSETQDILDNPSNHIDSKEYLSWEQYFCHFLVEQTKDSYKAYSKSNINEFYTIRENSDRIVAIIGLNK